MKSTGFLFHLRLAALVATEGLLAGLPLAGAIPSTERAALIALYKSTGGAAWSVNANWKTPPLSADGFALPGTEGTWQGVTVAGDRVTRLELPDNRLLGSLPAALGNLTALQALSLPGNQLSGSLPTQLGNLAALRTFDLSGNLLTGGIPRQLGNLGNLQELDLSANVLTGGIPSEFSGLDSLTTLGLQGNRLTGSLPSQIGGLTTLTSLRLEQNQLSGSLPSRLNDLVNLETLVLAGNRFSGSIPTEFAQLEKLEHLDLSANQLTGAIPPGLGGLSELLELDLSANLLSGGIPSQLGSLSRLKSLELGGNLLSGTIPSQLDNLVLLETLRLQGNQLSGTIPSGLTALTALTADGLDIGYNALYTSHLALNKFLNAHDPDWASTQTVAVTGVAAAALSPTSATVSWVPIAYTADGGGYRVFLATSVTGPFNLFGQTDGKSAASLPVTGLIAGTPYFFLVQTQTDPHAANQSTLRSKNSGVASTTIVTCTISGTVTESGNPVAGVSLRGLNGDPVTDAAGAYTATVISGWSGAATPTRVGYAFTPSGRTYSNVTGSLVGQDYTSVYTPTPTIGLGHARLNFGKAGAAISAAQTLTVRNTGAGTLNWTATASPSWVVLDTTSGTGNGTIQVEARAAGLASGTHTGTITITDPGADNSPQTVAVTLVVKGAGGNPSGSFDTPADGAGGIAGSIGVTGWAIDDVEITAVKIYRDPLGGEGSQKVYIGDASLVEGSRPDVESLYADVPWSYRAGWGYMLLTNFLPGSGNGTFRLYAYANDRDGHSVSLGSKRITCDNAHATLPFGTLDTPAQGGAASGSSYVNFGWALTPQPGTIPVDGSTLWVWVDGAPLGHPTYDQYREDIATLFPGYANSDGAVGFYYLNPAALAEGVHTIAWSVRDSLGREDGIGSRYFSVSHDESSGVKGTPGSGEDSALAKPPPQGAVSHDESFGLEGLMGNGNDPSFAKPSPQGVVENASGGVGGVGAKNLSPLQGESAITEIVDDPQPLRIRRGFASSEETLYPDRDGLVVVEARAGEPLTICLDPDLSGGGHEVRFDPQFPPQNHLFNGELGLSNPLPKEGPPLHQTGSTIRFAGHERVGDDVRALPAGSSLDPRTGVFTWLPGPGFGGTFRLEFVADRGNRAGQRHRLEVRLN